MTSITTAYFVPTPLAPKPYCKEVIIPISVKVDGEMKLERMVKEMKLIPGFPKDLMAL